MLVDITSNIFNNVINYITGQNAQDRFVNLLDSSPNIISDKDQADGYVGLDANANMFSAYYNENISRADLQTLLTNNLAVGYKFYQVNDADGAARILLVMADSNITLYPFALDLVTSEIGTYDITTDTFNVLAGTGNANVISTTVAALQGLQSTSSLSTTTFYNVTDAVGSTLVLQVYAIANNTNDVYAIDVATGAIGTYNITTDTFTAAGGTTPDLQAVTAVGNTTTNGINVDASLGAAITVDNGAGESVQIKHDQIIINTLIGNANITSPNLTTATEFQLPDKLTGPQTFAMLSDIVSGVTSIQAGTNISVDNTNPASPIVSSLADRYKTTSATSNSISNGSKTFTVDANLAYIPLQEVLIVYDASNHMHGEVTSYSGTTLVVDVKTHTGSGTYTSWDINLDGTPVDAITGTGTVNRLAYFTAAQVIDDAAAITAARALISDANGIPTHSATTSTELGYVSGVTSAIQTQINTAGTLSIECISGTITNPVDATTYYWCIGGTFLTASTSVTGQGSKFAYNFEIIGITIRMTTTTGGSAEDSTLYLRNITTSTSTLMGTFKTNGNLAYTSITGLTISCNTTDEYCLEMRSPTWATNPANLRLTASLFLRRT